ncbi:MAG: NADAR family protein [Niastella sp.]|nr:NADAR family protein [Niastella sp.]
MKYSLDILKQGIEAGQPVEYFLFWGHTQKQDGVVDKSCLSQWFPAPFTVDGVTYATAEHWMMAKKALLFGDQDAFQEILATPKPAVAKSICRKVKNFDAEAWKEVGYGFVTEGSFHKFSQHAFLKEFLIRTGKKVIVEASPFDAIWGIGLSQNSKEAMNPFKWRGTNLLGFALMEARDRLVI